MKKIKILILAGGGASTRLMFNGSNNDFFIEQVIIEKPVHKRLMLMRRVKTLGLMKVIGQLVFMAYNMWLNMLSKERITEIIENNNLSDNEIDERIITKVDSVNSEETIAILRKFRPDVVVVNGTRIIKKEILDAINVIFINTHVGITPRYRGVHGGYWALTESDIEHCGVTVHLVDSGIDTGGVLYQSVIRPTAKDNFNTYPYLQIAAAIPLMKKAIFDVSNGTYTIKESDSCSKLWSHPTMLEYLRHRVLRGVK